jgi:molybdopterin synthase catalytic subunit
MDINKMIDSLKSRSDFHQMGMIASHLGVVRGTSLNGQDVTSIEVAYDHKKLSQIASEIKQRPGIIEVLIETCEGRLNVGDDIMAVVIGGDTREHVFPALMDTVNRIKSESAKKRENF